MESSTTSNQSAGTSGRKNKGGRPTKKVKRSVIHMLRLTPLEQFAFSSKARQAGVSLSDYLRRAAQSGKVRPRLTVEEAAHLRTLAGLANNLNQLTRLSHQGGLLTLANSLSRALKDVRHLMQKLSGDDWQSDDR